MTDSSDDLQLTHFSSIDLGLTTPKIVYFETDESSGFQWDHEDPELIAAGINEITAEEWAEIVDRYLFEYG